MAIGDDGLLNAGKEFAESGSDDITEVDGERTDDEAEVDEDDGDDKAREDAFDAVVVDAEAGELRINDDKEEDDEDNKPPEVEWQDGTVLGEGRGQDDITNEIEDEDHLIGDKKKKRLRKKEALKLNPNSMELRMYQQQRKRSKWMMKLAKQTKKQILMKK